MALSLFCFKNTHSANKDASVGVSTRAPYISRPTRSLSTKNVAVICYCACVGQVIAQLGTLSASYTDSVTSGLSAAPANIPFWGPLGPRNIFPLPPPVPQKNFPPTGRRAGAGAPTCTDLPQQYNSVIKGGRAVNIGHEGP